MSIESFTLLKKAARISEVPTNWRLSTVGKEYDIRNDLRRPLSQSVRKGMQGKYPYYGPTGVVDKIDHFRVSGKFALIGEDGDHFLKYGDRSMTLLVEGEFNVNNHAHLVVGNESNLTEWFFYYFMHRNIFNSLTRQGAGRFKLNKSALLELPILIPPTKEQSRIIDIISCWDRGLREIDNLIEAKARKKSGLLQKIFDDSLKKQDWIGLELKEVISDFIVPMRDKPKDLSGPIPWCRIEDFDGVYLDGSKSGQGVTKETVSAMNLKVFPPGTLLVSCSANLGTCSITTKEVVTNQTFIGLVPDVEKVSPLFMYYAVSNSARRLNILASGTTISYLSRDQFEKFELAIPKDLKVQERIGNLLFSLDQELRLLELKKTKFIAQKKGLMQELLTGKKRVI